MYSTGYDSLELEPKQVEQQEFLRVHLVTLDVVVKLGLKGDARLLDDEPLD